MRVGQTHQQEVPLSAAALPDIFETWEMPHGTWGTFSPARTRGAKGASGTTAGCCPSPWVSTPLTLQGLSLLCTLTMTDGE